MDPGRPGPALGQCCSGSVQTVIPNAETGGPGPLEAKIVRRRTFLQTLAVAVAGPWTRLLAPGVREPLVSKVIPEPTWLVSIRTIDWDDFRREFANSCGNVAVLESGEP